MQRRKFIKHSAILGAGLSFAPKVILGNSNKPLPRWRGFNLMNKFHHFKYSAYDAWQLDFITEYGFDFVRVPMSYRCWMEESDWGTGSPIKVRRKKQIKHIDELIDMARSRGIHVNLNMHRIQGYCVNPPVEKLSVWSDPQALEAACWQWAYFAERYKGISSEFLSFDLINEPAGVDEPTYCKVVNALVETIRTIDPDRLIVADGRQWGTIPVPGLAGTGLGQSTRGYNPMAVSHYKATWVGDNDVAQLPSWPMVWNGKLWNRKTLYEDYIIPWKELEAKGVGIHVGEWGCYHFTPHDVALQWMEDNLSLWKDAGWGWSLWNLEGAFGIINSNRKDVVYESWNGRALDRKMLELLKQY